jgi:AcrR family transcriptional regulator
MIKKAKRVSKVNRRNQILQATDRLIRSRGLTGVTTRQISREVGCSEGALYFHFKGRLELLLAMLEESLPNMLRPLKRLQNSTGRGSPTTNLATALRGIFSFHRRVLPATAGLFAEPELLVAYRNSLAHQGKGPHLSMSVLAHYIASEKELGRIDAGVDEELAAYLLMASSFFRAFLEEFLGTPVRPGWDDFAKRLVALVAPETTASRNR